MGVKTLLWVKKVLFSQIVEVMDADGLPLVGPGIDYTKVILLTLKLAAVEIM